jgi:peroxiredoxin Q/BCP
LIGQPAPPFALRDQDERTVSLADLIFGGPLVLAFYPIDFSPVCTKQLCTYRDGYDDILAMGARVVGISPDPPARHREFITAKRLPFPLLSDPDGRVFRAYGVVPRLFSIRTRGLVIVGSDGRVLDERIETTMFTHRGATEVLAMLRTLKDR